MTEIQYQYDPSSNTELKIQGLSYQNCLAIPTIKFIPKFLTDKKLAYQTRDSACFDIYADIEEEVWIMPFGRSEPSRYLCSTGMYLSEDEMLHTAFDDSVMNAVLNIRPRSGLSVKHGIIVGGGEVDKDYLFPNEIKVLLINTSDAAFCIKKGERIAQARWTLTLKAIGVDTLDVERNNGFGSTGV